MMGCMLERSSMRVRGSGTYEGLVCTEYVPMATAVDLAGVVDLLYSSTLLMADRKLVLLKIHVEWTENSCGVDWCC